jgi:hypothetical protein
MSVVTKETTGANANFNLGLVDQDRSTEIDFDGFWPLRTLSMVVLISVASRNMFWERLRLVL